MQVVERSALVTYTPAQMFALVNDVPRYPEFLPWCIGVRVEDVSATERIAMLILEDFGIAWVRISLSKPGAIRSSRDVGVTLERGRDHLEKWRAHAAAAKP